MYAYFDACMQYVYCMLVCNSSSCMRQERDKKLIYGKKYEGDNTTLSSIPQGTSAQGIHSCSPCLPLTFPLLVGNTIHSYQLLIRNLQRSVIPDSMVMPCWQVCSGPVLHGASLLSPST